jgi:hypothetical protein
MRRALFRSLLILLAIVLPLKAAAALVVPIVGAPAALAAAQPQAALEHHGAHVTADGAPAPCCCDQETQDRLHDHGCPHLAMAVVASGAVLLPVASPTGQSAQHVSPPAPSVVLDVPCPPPTA